MKRRSLPLLAAIVFASLHSAEAQQPKKVPRIGFLATVSFSAISARTEAFRQGLRELEYVEGKSIVTEWRSAGGNVDRLTELAAELVRLKVEVIVTAAPPPTRAAKRATAAIPIIMAFDDDPVGSGFVANLARPGGNITGLATLSPELGGKQIELLKEIIPHLSRVAVFGTSTIPQHAHMVREIELAAKTLGVKLQHLDVQNPKDIEAAFRAASEERADAVLVLGSPVLNSRRTQIVETAAKTRVPATYIRPEYVEAGGLLTYGVNITDLFRRAATYVDKILKGAKPAELPIEQPTKFELIINLKTAKQIGLTIPPNVLARADKVIR